MSRFFNAGSSSHAKHFDLRLDDDYVVFRGNEEESASAHLKGMLVLCLSEPLTIKRVKLHLTGISHISYPASAGMSGGRKHVKENAFLEQTWTFKDAGKGKTEVLPADNYEFPFDIVLQGSLPESLEGLPETWITYRFKAEIRRKYAKDITVRKPFRIIRTLDPTDLELSHVMAIENIWPEKLEYSISTPSKAVIFGTSVKVDFRLIPLLKGLKIGQIDSQLVETCDFLLKSTDSEFENRSPKTTRIISTDSFQADTEQELTILHDDVEGYQFSKFFDLPRTLRKCVQDTDTQGIRIRHKLRFRVQLHNPAGHISELRASLPISIFISPHLPLDANNNLAAQSTPSAQREAFDLAQQAPPVYGEHLFDQLYSELDPNGYQSPPPGSGTGSPFGTHSRNISTENLAARLDEQDLSASALHNRLNNLPHNSSSTPPSPSASPESRPMSRRLSTATAECSSPLVIATGVDDLSSPEASSRPSEEDFPSGGLTPHPHYVEVEDLSRVPSYTTAVRSKPRTQYDTNPPDYESATAGDDSPTWSPRAPTPRVNRASTLGNPSQRHSLQLHNRNHSYHEETGTDTLLRIMQARAR